MKQRLSFDMPKEEHRYLKMMCAKKGITITDFIIAATIEKLEFYEDEILFKDAFENNDGENFVFIDENGVVNDL